MDKRNRKRTTGTGTKRNRRNQQIPNHIYLLAIAILLCVVIGMVFLIRRYTPTREHMSLSEFFVLNFSTLYILLVYTLIYHFNNAIIKINFF